MSSVVIAGDTSGSVTLQAPATAGSVVVTLPATSGTMVVGGTTPTLSTLTVTGSTNLATTGSSVLVGTTSAPGTGQLQVVANNNDGNTRLLISNNSAGSSAASYLIFGNDTAAGGFGGMRGFSSTNVSLGGANSLETFNNVGTLTFSTAGTTRMTVDYAGAVGINIAGSSSKLCVNATGVGTYGHMNNGNTAPGGSTPWLATLNGTNAGTATYGWAFYDSNSTGNLEIWRRNNSTTGNAVMVMDRSVGKVYVNNTGSFGGMLQSTGVAGISAAASMKPGQNGDGTLEWYNASNGYVSAVTVNASTVVYGTSSDYRLKENVVPMQNALSVVAQLKPCTFDWIETKEKANGFIAHELQEIIPEAVTGTKDAVDIEGKPKYQGVDTSFLVATLTAAIQELNAKVTALEAQLAGAK